MKKGFYILTAALLSLSVTVTALAGPIYIGPEVEQVVTYDENGNKVIILIFDPAKTPDFMKDEIPETEFEKIPPLTEAPEIGATLGHILKEGENLDVRTADSYTEPYATNSIGECAWYADGRFMEVHGIRMPFGMGAAGEWIDNAYKSSEIKIVTDLNQIPEQSIAVFKPSENYAGWPGHVEFIEYVEKDSKGNPINIYFTDTNGTGDLNKGRFDEGYDGIVKMKPFDEFKNQYGLILVGYIVPNVPDEVG